MSDRPTEGLRNAPLSSVLDALKRTVDAAVYVRIDADMLRRVGQHLSELQGATEAKVTQSDAIRDLIRRGLDEADVENGRRAKRRR